MCDIKIRKGRNIDIPGTAAANVVDIAATDYAVKPTDFVGVTPRLLVAEGDTVAAGTPLFEDKANPGIPFVSPVAGTVKAIVRGAKRALLAVVVHSDAAGENAATDGNKAPGITVTADGSNAADINTASGISTTSGQSTATDENTAATQSAAGGKPIFDNVDELRSLMQRSGLWTLLKQRPFGIVPAPDAMPKAVFITAFDSAPLPVDTAFALQGREEDFQQGIDILHTLAGTVHLALDGCRGRDSFLAGTANAEIHYFRGPHPAGLVGTHIAYIDPINKGETVWTVNAQDVATIGHYFRCGEYLPLRTVALCGPSVKEPRYFRLVGGATIASFVGGDALSDPHSRIICGDVLSGVAVADDGFLSAACDKVSVIPEGDYYDFLGWLRPNFRKFSFSRTFLSGLLSRLNSKRQGYQFDTGQHGGRRPLFVTGEFEKLVPLNICPMQLIKACITGDIEMMEALGIYEVEPEDLALCEFADTSKTEIQAAIRSGLELLRKEC